MFEITVGSLLSFPSLFKMELLKKNLEESKVEYQSSKMFSFQNLEKKWLP